ncbi:MAG: long-chain-fatty-acid--CoA ligase [Planctomycetota bacterium]
MLFSFLDKAARLRPDRIAVVAPGVRWTYSELHHRSLRLARAFLDLSLEPGDRVAVLSPNDPAFLECYFAAAAAGLVLVPLNVRLAPPELEEILADAGARTLVVHPDVAERVKCEVEHVVPIGLAFEAAIEGATDGPLPARPAESDPAQIYYTSGTTGRPKGVILTHGNVASHALGTIAELKLDDADVWGHVAPLYHLADAWATFAITLAGGTHVVMPRFDPAEVLAAFRETGVTITNLIPTMLSDLVHHPDADGGLPAFRTVMSGGAPVAPSLVRKAMDAFGCEFVQTYGLTETSPYLTMSLLREDQRGLSEEAQFAIRCRTGREFVTVELRVVRPDGTDVAADDEEVGEIRARGPSVTAGYWNRPVATASAFDGEWLKTGDLATIDGSGSVNIVDRMRDMIITGGENVYSTEVEHVLHEIRGVREVAVVGAPDDRWGEIVTAVISAAPGADVTEQTIRDHCAGRLADFKIPRRVEFLENLPRTGSGKIAKRVIREGLAGMLDSS